MEIPHMLLFPLLSAQHLEAHFFTQQPSAAGSLLQKAHFGFPGQPTSARPTSTSPQEHAGGVFASQGSMPPSSPQYTDLLLLLKAMSIQPPPDNNYYMDIEASTYMNFNQGIMFSFNSKSTIVGNK